MSSLQGLLRRAAGFSNPGSGMIFDGQHRSWGEVVERCRTLGGLLSGLTEPGDRVAVLALNSDRYVELMIACPWAGAIYVPINTRLARAELEALLSDCMPAVLAFDDHFRDLAPGLAAAVGTVRTLLYIGRGTPPDGSLAYDAAVPAAVPLDPFAGSEGSDICTICYTGGTTARAKGVLLSHRNLIASLLQGTSQMTVPEGTRMLLAAPMFHQAGSFATLVTLLRAGRLVLQPAFHPAAFSAAARSEEVDGTLLVPTMINMILSDPAFDAEAFAAVRYMIYGASPMPEALLLRLGRALPQVKPYQVYGQTEAAPLITLLRPEDHDPALGARIRSAGQPLPGVEVKIIGADGAALPTGEVGELCARGANTAVGYWRQPEVTAAAMRGSWLHTGDGAFMDEDGFVHIVDRIKDMIISGGENIFSVEVEQAIYEHEAVLECAVIGVPSDLWGEAVHAVVRLKDGKELGPDDLQSFCRDRIAGYKVPRTVEFSTAPLPVSGAGKILKSAIRAPHWAGRAKAI